MEIGHFENFESIAIIWKSPTATGKVFGILRETLRYSGIRKYFGQYNSNILLNLGVLYYGK